MAAVPKLEFIALEDPTQAALRDAASTAGAEEESDEEEDMVQINVNGELVAIPREMLLQLFQNGLLNYGGDGEMEEDGGGEE